MIFLKNIVKSILNEAEEKYIAKVLTAKENYYTYLDKNKGVPFSVTEINFIKGLEDKPSDIKPDAIVYNTADVLSAKQDITTIKKFQKSTGYTYVAFKSLVSPHDISPDTDNTQPATNGAVEPDANQAGEAPDETTQEKDSIRIYFSSDFIAPNGDLKLFYNFLQSLDD